jgi:hypothetical protein
MATKPLVSIFCVTYNHRPYIQQCLDSLLAQKTDFPFEIIVHDDASTDGTTEVIKEYELRYPEIVVPIYQKENQYSKGNRRIMASFMICVARGKYIAFCEGDDFWHRSDKLQRQVAVLQDDPRVSLVCSSWRVVSSEGSLVKEDALVSKRFRKSDISTKDVLLSGVVMTLTVCALRCYVQRALCESPLCRNHTYPFGDTPLWFELSRYGRLCCMPEVFASYRLSDNSATRSVDPLQAYQFNSKSWEFQNDVLDLYPLAQGEGVTAAAKIHATRSCLRAVAICGDPTTARKQLARLRTLNVTPTPRDRFLCCVAHIPLPRAALLSATRKSVQLWRSVWKTKLA